MFFTVVMRDTHQIYFRLCFGSVLLRLTSRSVCSSSLYRRIPAVSTQISGCITSTVVSFEDAIVLHEVVTRLFLVRLWRLATFDEDEFGYDDADMGRSSECKIYACCLL